MILKKKNVIITKDESTNIFEGIFLDNIYFYDNLHAKLYFNENTALITSMNLLDYSIKNNLEIGCLLNRGETKKMRKQFYEKYLAKPNIIVRDEIIGLENKLNNTEKNIFKFPLKIIL